MYMLKSAMVPIECPHCGSTSGLSSSSGDALSGYSANGSQESITSGSPSSDKKGRHKYPPCPACARCPEPSFVCKKVPNYRRAGDLDELPRPILNDFSTFGM
jgi:sarcosine oxidase delta subunit